MPYRCFVVEGDEVTRLSQKTFNAFYFRKQPALTQYTGRTPNPALKRTCASYDAGWSA
jgi:hypothetical protein